MQHVASSLLAGMLLFAGAGCGGEPTGPVELAPTYLLQSADGRALPVRSFRTVSNEAGTCVYDLVDGLLGLDERYANYTLSFSHRVSCAGGPDAVPAHDSSMGKFSRSGNTLTFSPRTFGTFTVTEVRVTSGAADVLVRMNSGEAYTFRFIESRD